jgi:heme/copper-type cytochrome/quinol oxidase subunit 2
MQVLSAPQALEPARSAAPILARRAVTKDNLVDFMDMKRTTLRALLSCVLLALITGCSRPTPQEHIKVVMKKYQIDPGVIRVKSGEIVELDLSTPDVEHGFEVQQLGIKEAVQPGRPASFVFKAPAKGEYQVTCGVLCGPHHDDMQAKLIVE